MSKKKVVKNSSFLNKLKNIFEKKNVWQTRIVEGTKRKPDSFLRLNSLQVYKKIENFYYGHLTCFEAYKKILGNILQLGAKWGGSVKAQEPNPRILAHETRTK